MGGGAGGEVGAVALSVWVWGPGAGFCVRCCAVFGFVAWGSRGEGEAEGRVEGGGGRVWGRGL